VVSGDVLGAERSESWCAMRSARRRVFTVMSVVRCEPISSTSRR
jgi:hypothetical protein